MINISVIPPFRQVKMPSMGRIIDRGVTMMDGDIILVRVKSNTPRGGQYYVNERYGIYIFVTRDTTATLNISYTDLEAPKRDALRDFTLKPLVPRVKKGNVA